MSTLMRCVLIGFCVFLVVGAVIGLELVRGAKREPPVPGSYRVGSRIDDERASGFASCKNFSKASDGFPGNRGQVSLVASPYETFATSDKKYIVVRLVNRTADTIAFSACDSRLYLVQEALADNGEWKAIEDFPTTRCGNSYHRVFLEPNRHWELHAEHRQGTLKTKLRFRLNLNGAGANGDSLFSNEFEGSIEPNWFKARDLGGAIEED